MQKLLDNTCELFVPTSESYTKPAPKSNLIKIGTDYGGWVVPINLLDENSICYCVGCGEDISFDLGLINNLSCDVYGFDPTPRAIDFVKSVAKNNPKYHFLEYGLWDCEDRLKFFVPKNPEHVSHSLVNLQNTSEYIYVKVKRLSAIMADLGHEKIDLLKIDIEGAEYKVIESIIEDNIDINVICVEYDEYHNPVDTNYKNRIRASINNMLSNGYSIVCAQGNGNFTFLKTNTGILEFNNKHKIAAGSIKNFPTYSHERIDHCKTKRFETTKQIDALEEVAKVFNIKDLFPTSHTVIHFGCNDGFLLDQLQVKRKIGVELDSVARSKALMKGVFAIDSIDLIPDNIADIIISSHTLEHVKTPLQSLNKLRPKLKSDGRAIFVVPYHEPQDFFGGDDINGQIYFWNPLIVEKLFKAAGFTVISIDTIQHQWPLEYIQGFVNGNKQVISTYCENFKKVNDHHKIRIVAGNINY